MEDSFFAKHINNSTDSASISLLAMLNALMKHDKEVALILMEEIETQKNSIKLIPSENYSSIECILSSANMFSDKYAEGSPNNRYYQGCKSADKIESLCEQRAMKIFPGFDAVNVQPHCGSDANLLAFCTILATKMETPELMRLSEIAGRKLMIEDLTDEERESFRKKYCSKTLLGIDISAGGHLTHGSLRNISSRLFRAVHFGIEEDGSISYTKLRELANREKPFILIAGITAYPRNINFALMREIADECGATLIGDMSHISGLVAAGVFEGDFNPLKHSHIITSTTHKSIRSGRGGIVLAKAPFHNNLKRGCPMMMGGPLMHLIAAKAVGFKEADCQEFKDYGSQILKNSSAMANVFNKHSIPLFTNGTDNHLIVVNTLKGFSLGGKAAAKVLEDLGITTNANAFPGDNFRNPSGVRMGSPAMTSRGLKEKDMAYVAEICVEAFQSTKETERGYYIDPAKFDMIKSKVKQVCDAFPIYPNLPSFAELIN